MPVSPSSGNASANPIPAATDVKVGLLKKLARYLGFQTVSVVTSSKPHLPKESATSGTPIRERSVKVVDTSPETRPLLTGDKAGWSADFQEHYIGHRSNQKNLETLFKDLTSSGVGRRDNESDTLYEARVRLGMVASGMANLDEGGNLSSRRQVNRALSAQQFQKLEGALSGNVAELAHKASARGQLNNQHMLNTSWGRELLGASAGQYPMKTPEDFHQRQQLLQEYFISGEGQNRLASLDFPGASEMGKYLLTNTEKLKSSELGPATQYLDAAKKDGATEASIESEVKYVTDHSGALVTVTKEYNPANVDMRCLALLQELYYLDTAYLQCLTNRAMGGDDIDLDDMQSDRANLQGAFMGASHCLMRQALPEQMQEKSYTHTVLKNTDGMNQWDSDMPQPRKEWLGNQPIKPIRA